jgi:predicted ATP-grasp superfamily ATP-dependent carboligase
MTLGTWEPNAELQSMAQRLAVELGYSGILDLDFRYDPASRNYYLLDFNPRLGAQFRLFTDRQGLDLVRVLYLDLTGQPVPELHAQYHRAYLVENYDPLSTAPQLWNRTFSVSDWWNSLRNIDELAWFASDDLRPFLVMALRWFGHCYQRLRSGPITTDQRPRQHLRC